MMNPALARFWQQHGLTAILSAAGLAGIAAIGVESRWGAEVHLPETRSGTGSAGAPEILATYPVFTLPPLTGGFTESAERPLFLPSRRPIPIGPAASAQVMKKGQFKLSGTTVEKDLSVAYLVETATNKTVRVTKGKEVLGVPGLVADQVEATRVVLKMGEETETLELRTAASPPKPATPPGAAPGAPGSPSVPGVAPVAGMQPVPQPLPAPFAPQPAVAPAIAPTQAAGAAMQPGASVMPGFVLPSGGPGAAGQTAPPTDAAAAQRRRRFQNLPQQ